MLHITRLMVTMMLFGTAFALYANQNQAGIDFGRAMNATTGSLISKSESALPLNKANTSDLEQYYENPHRMKDDAFTKTTIDRDSAGVNDLINNRKRTTLSSKDPLFQNQEEIENKATGLLSSNYQGCVDLPVGNTSRGYSQAYCEANLVQDGTFQCISTKHRKCTNPKKGLLKVFSVNDFSVYPNGHNKPLFIEEITENYFRFGSYGDNYRDGDCKWYTDVIEFNAGDGVQQFQIEDLVYDDWAVIFVNGEKVIQAVGGNYYAPDGRYECETKRSWHFPEPVNIRGNLVEGRNRIVINHLVGGKGEVAFRFKIKSLEDCDPIYQWERQCDAGQNPVQANLQWQQCSEYKYGGCGKYTENYTGSKKNVWREANQCSVLRNNGCSQVSDSCTLKNGDDCVKRNLSFKCGGLSTKRSVSMCGDTMICPDGDCGQNIGRDVNTSKSDFKEAATKLSVADELTSGMNKSLMKVFRGEPKTCEKLILGVGNCCKDKGWGIDLGLARCAAHEKELGLAKQDKRTHFIGSYKERNRWGIYVSRHYSYCTYSSKLSRIIIEQGKAQLGRGFGTPKQPDCGGFTINELNSLNFDAMDFSEFYEDVQKRMQGANKPTNNQAQELIKQRIKDKFSNARQ